MAHSKSSTAEKLSEFKKFLSENASFILPNSVQMPLKFSAPTNNERESKISTENVQENYSQDKQILTIGNLQVDTDKIQNKYTFIEANDATKFTNPYSCPLCSIHGEGTPCGNDIVEDWKACAELKSFFFGREKGGEDVLDPDAVKLAKKWRNQYLLERLSENASSEQERQQIKESLDKYEDHFKTSDDFCQILNDRFFGCMMKWMQSNPQYYQQRASIMMHSFDFPVETANLYLESKRLKRYRDQGML